MCVDRAAKECASGLFEELLVLTSGLCVHLGALVGITTSRLVDAGHLARGHLSPERLAESLRENFAARPGSHSAERVLNRLLNPFAWSAGQAVWQSLDERGRARSDLGG